MFPVIFLILSSNWSWFSPKRSFLRHKPQPKECTAETQRLGGLSEKTVLRVSAVNFLLPPYECAAKKAEYAEKKPSQKTKKPRVTS